MLFLTEPFEGGRRQCGEGRMRMKKAQLIQINNNTAIAGGRRSFGAAATTSHGRTLAAFCGGRRRGRS